MDKFDAKIEKSWDKETAAEIADRLRLEGNESFRLNDFKKAVELYTKSLEAEKTVPALLNRSFCYVKIERFEAALSDADEALQMEPNNLKGKCRRGVALRELGHYSLALKEFGACLEHDSESNNFQELYDQCQTRFDEKTFLNLNLEIVGYKNDPSHGEMHLSLATGHPSNPGIKRTAKTFEELTSCGEYLKNHVKGAFGTVHISNSVIDEELMKFFRSLDPLALTPGILEFYNVRCTRNQFAELFGGHLFRPMTIWFCQMERTEYDMSTAFRLLTGIRNAKFIQFGATRFDQFSSEENQRFNNNAANKVNLGTVLALLHHPHPDIPAHIRACPRFFRQASLSPSIRASLTPWMSAGMGVASVRCMAGRLYLFDLHHLGGGGANNEGAAKVADVIQECIQRFRSARSPVSYVLQLRFMMPQRDQTRDFAALAQLMQQRGGFPTVFRNGCGERLALLVTPKKKFKEPMFLLPGEPNGEIVQLDIARTLLAAPGGNKKNNHP